MTKKNNLDIYRGLIAYIAGLLFTGFFLQSQGLLFSIGILTISIVISVIIFFKPITGVNISSIFLLGLIVISGFFYYYWRFPSLDSLDIRNQISSVNSANNVAVTGKIISNPRLNQNQKARFVLQAEKLITSEGNSPTVTGKVYVTAPLLSVIGLFPSTQLTVIGKLYQPLPPLNPGGFDFASYLEREGIFSGLSAKSVSLKKEGNWWQKALFYLRLRMIQTHVRYLDVPLGNLVSSMVIGSRAVDLDFDLQNSFRLAGLAHTLAASGFHVSLLLGTVLFFTRSLSPRHRLWIGILSLLIYTTVTGFYPSILRSSLMGIVGLIAMINERSVKSSGILLLAGVILLLINPLWIWDIGFQLSFLATLGLIVSLSPIVNKLDWLPPTIANLVAVPLAATIWTLPLVCYHFNHIPVYGILTNILATPFVIIITLVGIFSAFIGVFIPVLGSSIAFLLYPVIRLLIILVEISNKLPFSSLAVGKISIISLILGYLIIILITFNKWCQKYWLSLTLFTFIFLTIPLIYQKFTLQQLTIMTTRDKPVIVIQNRGKNAIINLNDKNNVLFNLLGFLKSQGINNLELVLVNNNTSNQLALKVLQKYISIESVIYPTQKTINSLQIIDKNNNYIYFQLFNSSWLLLQETKNIIFPETIKTDIIISPNNLKITQILKLKPKVLITNLSTLNKKNLEDLSINNIKILSWHNGAIQWQPETGFINYDE
ncbi:ComEC/Rec2 family competence protein [Geminocystis sp. NIES-3709]|uniref:ComEC/Rec2 family competence protein n=1 Tax=Geminocystis sp. NIES-3709 TaxID=1617448 RepID=UPI0005FCC4E2|nr:ComEC/Rec2 family competence protein [Geminocystis sp. NIES-3709]BAQ63666.1 ComEC/Rec2-related protein [Geminocystis sp. NIES-3709]